MKKLQILFFILLLSGVLYADGYNSSIHFLFTIDTLSCKKSKIVKIDGKEIIKQDSLILPNELHKIIREKEQGKLVVRNFETKDFAIIPISELDDNTIEISYDLDAESIIYKLTKDEILLSYCFNRNFDFGLGTDNEKSSKYLINYLYKVVTEQKNKKSYTILCSHKWGKYHYIYTKHSIPANLVKKICEFQINRVIKNERPSKLFSLCKEIVYNENIPACCKTLYINWLSYNYLSKERDDMLIKKEYSDYILKVINEATDIQICDFKTYTNSDIISMLTLFENAKKKLLTPKEFYSISKKVIAANKNPAVSLEAYSIMEYYYLSKNDIKKAFETAIKSLKIFNKPILWNDNYGEVSYYFNIQPATMFIDYIMFNENDPELILSYIDKLYNTSNYHPEFQNYLLYRKAIIKELSSYSLEETIKAYENVDTKFENYKIFNQKFLQISYLDGFWRIDTKILPQLKNFRQYTITVGPKVTVKQYLLQKNSKEIDIQRKEEISIFQEAPYIFSKYGDKLNNPYFWWLKGKINGKIYWILDK